jgi:hypothetical protein
MRLAKAEAYGTSGVADLRQVLRGCLARIANSGQDSPLAARHAPNVWVIASGGRDPSARCAIAAMLPWLCLTSRGRVTPSPITVLTLSGMALWCTRYTPQLCGPILQGYHGSRVGLLMCGITDRMMDSYHAQTAKCPALCSTCRRNIPCRAMLTSSTAARIRVTHSFRSWRNSGLVPPLYHTSPSTPFQPLFSLP